MKAAFPQIRQIAPFLADYNDQIVISNNNETVKKFKEEKGFYVTTPSFFKIFNFPLLAGSYESLKDPNTVLLSKETAEKYFGDWQNALGKTIKLNNTDVIKVTGILATIPANTDMQIKLAVSYGTGATKNLMNSTNFDGTSGDFGCYILLPQNVSASAFDKQLRAYSKKVKSPDNKDEQTIQPLKDIHFDTQTGDFSGKHISLKMIDILWLIAAFILLIACVNFINLSTAQAVNRAKEVGVRKVLGSNRSQLRIQFIVETFLIVITAVMLAAVITALAAPSVSRLLELSLTFNLFGSPAIILFLLTVTVVVTALAGFYPSIVLSRFNPVNALKSKLTSNTQGISLRRGLVVFQFIIAQALIIGTLVIVRQMNFFMDQPLGFDKEAVINVPFRMDTSLSRRLDYLKNQLLSVNGVKTVSLSSNTPVENSNDLWSALRFNHAIKET